MAELLQFEKDGVMVAVRTSEDLIQPTSVADKTVRVLDQSLGEVLDVCSKVGAEFAARCQPLLVNDIESAELEVGFQFTTKGSLCSSSVCTGPVEGRRLALAS